LSISELDSDVEEDVESFELSAPPCITNLYISEEIKGDDSLT
jgi:hypothetical protein